MKTKKLSKKLGLNKKTIAHLSNFEINGVLGGQEADTVPITSGIPVCPTFNINCCTYGDPPC